MSPQARTDDFHHVKVTLYLTEYISRFRDTKNRGYSLVIFEKDLAELALNGLRYHIKENWKVMSS